MVFDWWIFTHEGSIIGDTTSWISVNLITIMDCLGQSQVSQVGKLRDMFIYLLGCAFLPGEHISYTLLFSGM